MLIAAFLAGFSVNIEKLWKILYTYQVSNQLDNSNRNYGGGGGGRGQNLPLPCGHTNLQKACLGLCHLFSKLSIFNGIASLLIKCFMASLIDEVSPACSLASDFFVSCVVQNLERNLKLHCGSS